MFSRRYFRKEVGSRGGRIGQREKLAHFVNAAGFIADRAGSSGAGMAFKICVKLRQDR